MHTVNKGRSKKSVFLRQAALASTVLLMPPLLMADIDVYGNNPGDKADNDSVTPGNVVSFEDDFAAIIDAGFSLGLPNQADINNGAPPNTSAFTLFEGGGSLILGGHDAVANPNLVEVPGNIGTPETPIKFVGVDPQSAGAVAIFEGNIYAEDIQIYDTNKGFTGQVLFGSQVISADGDILLTGDHTVFFDSTAHDIAIETGIDTANNNEGTLVLLGGNQISIVGEIGNTTFLKAVNIDGGTQLNLQNETNAAEVKLFNNSIINILDDMTFTGGIVDLNFSGTLNLNDFLVAAGGDFAMGANDKLIFQVSDSVEANAGGTSRLTVGNAAIVDPDASLVVLPTGYLSDGTVINVISDTGAMGSNLNALNANIIGNSAVLSFSQQFDAASKTLQLVAARTPYTALDLSSDAAGLGQLLEGENANLAVANATLSNAIGLVDRLDTVAAVNELLSMLGPTANLAVGDIAHQFNQETLSTIHHRLNHLFASTQAGVSAGDDVNGIDLWGQIFARHFDQSKRGNVLGYDGETVGFSLGIDWQFDNATIGMAGSYSQANADYDLAQSRLDVESIQGTLYARTEYPDNAWYWQGMFGVAHHDYDQHRNILLPGTARIIANGDFGAWEWLAQAQFGHRFEHKGWHWIPALSLRGSRLKIADYEETGAGDLNLTVNTNNISELVASFDLQVDYAHQADNYLMIPEGHLRFNYDFIADRQASTSQFRGINQTFVTESFKPAHSSVEMGVGLNIHTAQETIFSLNYDYLVASDFNTHSGYLTLQYQWQ